MPGHATAKAAAVQYLLADSHAQFPFRLFDLLEPGANIAATAAKLLSEPPCMRDPYSAAFLQRHDTPQKLSSPTALSELVGVAALAHTDISAIECRHAQMRRVTLLRAAGAARTKSLECCSAELIFIRQRLLAEHAAAACNAPEQRRKAGRPRLQKTPAKAKALSTAPHAVARRAKRSPRRGGGGPWRAFVSERFRGREMPKTKREWAPVRAEYRSLTGAEKARLAFVGRLMSFAHRARPRVARRRHRMAPLCDPSVVHLLPLVERAAQPQAQEPRQPGSEQQEQAQRQQGAGALPVIPIRPSRVVTGPPGLRSRTLWPSVRRRLQADGRQQKSLASKKARTEHMRVQRIRQAEAEQLLLGDAPPEFLKAVPTHADLRFLMWAQGCAMWQWVPPVAGMLKHALPLLPTTAKESLAQSWRASHDIVRHAAVPPIMPPPPVRQICRVAGRCLCSGQGARLRAFESSLIQSFRKLFPSKSRPRTLMEQGMLCIRLQSGAAEFQTTGQGPFRSPHSSKMSALFSAWWRSLWKLSRSAPALRAGLLAHSARRRDLRRTCGIRRHLLPLAPSHRAPSRAWHPPRRCWRRRPLQTTSRLRPHRLSPQQPSRCPAQRGGGQWRIRIQGCTIPATQIPSYAWSCSQTAA